MGMEFEMKGKQQSNVYYVNAPVPCVVEENYGGYFNDHDVSALAEDLQSQESVYESFLRNAPSDTTRASSSNNSRHNHDHVSKEAGRNSLTTAIIESQLSRDEALARELQELENHLASASLGGITGREAVLQDTDPTQSSSANLELNFASSPVQVAQEDGIDPDNMTYEELQQLGEAIGTESKGLSDELISFLPTSTYRIGLFSKKEKHEECVICYMAYKNRDKLMTLPCKHQYHKTCVTKWLKINKACPVCNVEVFGS
ncbi:E3 ubiquitin-protein ligase BIG BROTHER-like [Phoenix dactylifera]|uniref:E3 ubiquitin-protein ligase BIG BROTHER-like n=1 Tax=Phoenix dactylifera TaxID=42345 RepID=A0A8B8ZWW2_PHODC|nr:E3 ubiquitin-protein ligase BIG BROTHER-like [Phoenix dactylifera]XP_038978795.1 E3 ubiquitin-protein ligase BIG BROTHER-like [Phoenix dactylifera]